MRPRRARRRPGRDEVDATAAGRGTQVLRLSPPLRCATTSLGHAEAACRSPALAWSPTTAIDASPRGRCRAGRRRCRCRRRRRGPPASRSAAIRAAVDERRSSRSACGIQKPGGRLRRRAALGHRRTPGRRRRSRVLGEGVPLPSTNLAAWTITRGADRRCRRRAPTAGHDLPASLAGRG